MIKVHTVTFIETLKEVKKRELGAGCTRSNFKTFSTKIPPNIIPSFWPTLHTVRIKVCAKFEKSCQSFGGCFEHRLGQNTSNIQNICRSQVINFWKQKAVFYFERMLWKADFIIFTFICSTRNLSNKIFASLFL